jgi:hypothetical protein
MFRIVSIIGFAATIVAVGLHRVLCRRNGPSATARADRLLVLGLLRRLAYLFGLLSSVALVVTGFYPILIFGTHIEGYMVMLHVTTGGVFAGCTAVLALMCAEHNRFGNSQGPGIGQKAAFWLILVLALPVILSIVLTMLGLFGTEGQKFLLNIHRYSALLFALAAMVHGYLTIRTRARR